MRRFKAIILSAWAIMVAVLAASTFFLSTPVYGHWWFVSLWAVMAALLVAAMAATRMWRMLPSMLLHTSFLLILAGGLATWLGGRTGTIVLAPGETAQAYSQRDGSPQALSLPVTLESFETVYYPGTMAPRDYVSHLRIGDDAVDLAVNKPADVGSARLYQSSFLPDGSSVIGVTDDRPGKWLSFSGYLLFAIGGLLTLISRRGRFRSLLRTLGVVAAMLAAPAAVAQSQQVLYNGRVAPLSTPATDLLLKVSGQRTLGGVKAEDVMKSMLAYPEQWRDKRFIFVKNSALRDSLGIPSKYASVDDLFDAQGNYRLLAWYDPHGTSDFDKALLQLDEKIELLLKLHSGEFFKPVPDDMPPLPRWRVVVEDVYNAIPFTKIFFIAALTIGLLLLVLTSLTTQHSTLTTQHTGLWTLDSRHWTLVTRYSLLLLLLWQLTGYVARWIIYGRIPLGNTAETLVFISIALLILALFFTFHSPLVTLHSPLFTLHFSLFAFLSGFAALVANISQSDPVVTPLVPVLSSPWLGIHVTLVMSAYSLLVLACVVSAVGFNRDRARTLSLTLLHPAVYLLGLGIFTGAVWAEVAWGRYWAWDPKETWALITFMVYAVPLHTSIRALARPCIFNLYVLLGALTLLMTYFGVNYLGGLHAYS